ncbi:endonuclease/exonuclease/phosphatase family protein [Yersinia sp. Marseille-Q3913]|uniref:cytolethal distending toxin subunit B family protein n=1 Tax=Yersinia sp. Marseille-Q3913 TaxID=2830769 RepID=UPI001BAEC1F0|nr:endonuclease/exonuclease/phosphatase family protein [Yersinia sp. Marseille-Q3913]MBS0057052.1 endonuclease/exonuclease/phosphatase family protein [Yersinia sp. Marseille-Q3913]
MRRLFKVCAYSLSLLFLAAHADVTDYKLASWNMQGAQSGHGSNSKWVTGVAGMLNIDGIDIVALQETGAAPPSAIALPILRDQHPEIERRIPQAKKKLPMTSLAGGSVTIINPRGQGVDPNKVREFILNLGSSTRPKDFYIYQFDNGRTDAASRINLALVSRVRADEVIIIPPMAIGANTRPTLGIRIGDDYFFSLHARAAENNEAPQIIQFIDNYMTSTVQSNRSAATWIVMGDYNRTSEQLVASFALLNPRLTHPYQIASPNQVTQQSNRTIDYAVMGRLNQGGAGGGVITVPLIAALLTYASDHMAVQYMHHR